MSYKLTQTGQEVQALLNQIKNGGQSQVTDAVLYTPQNLEEKEQEQARKNIGAAAENQIPTGAVLYSQKQDLESNQQAQARANIGAVGTEQLPKKVSELVNDAHYITENQVPVALPQKTGAIQSGVLPTTGWDTLGWKQNTLPAQDSWRSVAYGNGKFVAVVPSGDKGAYSTDGINWTEMTLPASRNWQGITYGNGKFVAVAYRSDKGAYSTDGINWTEMTMPESQKWATVTYGNGKFVALSDGSITGAYSTNGINWTEMTMPELPVYDGWESVAYGNGKYVAIVRYSTNGAYSTDGINWNIMTMPADKYWHSVTYGDGKFVAVVYNSSVGAYSTDGINWTEMTMPASVRWTSVAHGDGKYVAVASSSNGSIGACSTDGITWIEMAMPANTYSCAAYGNGKFVAVASNNTNGAYWEVADGADREAFTGVTYSISDTNITANSDVLMELTDEGGARARTIASGSIQIIRGTVPTTPISYTYKVKQTNASGQFTVVNHFVPEVPTKTSELTNDSGFITSADIPTTPTSLPVTYKRVSGELPTTGWNPLGWEQSTLPSINDWRSVAYGNDKFVAIGDEGGRGAYSTDGMNWTGITLPSVELWNGIAYGNGKFVAVATSTDKGAYSVDGINWTLTTMPSSPAYHNWIGVAYGNGKFVTLTLESSYCAYSTDGINWTSTTMPTKRNWRRIAYGNDKFVAVAKGTDKGAYSTDGITWTEMSMPASRNWQNVTYGDGKFVAVADGEKGAYSADGINWTEMTLPISRNWSCIAYGDGKFVAVEYNGIHSAYSTDGINWTAMTTPIVRAWSCVVYGDNKFVLVSSGAASSSQNNKALYWEVNSNKSTYTISDTFITTNTSVKMYLTDESRVKALRMSIGSITVLRDSVPTTAIPYKYEVKQTSTPGGFDVINSYVPTVPTKTSELTNDSGFVTQADIPATPTSLPVTYKKVSGSLPTSGWNTLWWKQNTMPTSASWSSVVYGDGKFVAVAEHGDKSAYSTDGINWIETTLPARKQWQSIAYGNGKFVAVAYSSAYGAYSIDGINWTNMMMSDLGNWVVTYGGSKFVAVSDSSVSAYSTDGINWIKTTLPASRSWQSIAYGNGKFVAVAWSSDKGAYSTDGINWIEMSMPASRMWRSVASEDGKFVAVAQNSDKGAYSTDGITWAEMSMPASRGWRSVASGDGKFVAVAYDSSVSAYSMDGINWIETTLPANQKWHSVTYGNGKYVAVAYPNTYGAYWDVFAQPTYTIAITDTDITTNTSVKMYLTDDGGVKAHSKAAGSIQVIRDTVPTTAIPYEYEVEQTSADGLFEVINAYVPTKTSELTNDSGFVTQAAIPTKVSQLTNDRGFTTNIGTITQVKVNGEIKAPDTAGLVDLGNVTPEPTDWTTVPITTALENGKTYVVKLDTTPYPLTAIFTMSAALDAIDANVVGGTQQGTDGASTYELKSATITVKDGKLTGLKSTNLVSSANPGAANLSYSESTFADLGITQYHYVELLNTVGGGSAAPITYTKLAGGVHFESSYQSASNAFFVNADAATWTTLGEGGPKALTSTSDLGLRVGDEYEIYVNIDGTKKSFSGTVENGASALGVAGSKILMLDDGEQGFVIYDHCDFSQGYPQKGNGSIIMASLSSSPTSANITRFTGTLEIVSPATITNPAIKINSAVTMYINSDITLEGTKTDGSITLSASSGGSVAYDMEILDTATEGLFEVVNNYIPTPQPIPVALPQQTSVVKTAKWTKGETTVSVTDSDITETSDVVVNIFYEGSLEISGGKGGFTIESDVAAGGNRSFEYKIKQTNNEGQFTVVNQYTPSTLPIEYGYFNGVVDQWESKVPEAFFIGQDATKWSGPDGGTLVVSASRFGLIVGNQYTLTANVNNTAQTFTATAILVTNEDFSFPGLDFNLGSDQHFVIYDCVAYENNNMTSGSGSIVMLMAGVSSFVVTAFEGERQKQITATITNSWITTNSAVTMYVNSPAVLTGVKTDGQIVLTTDRAISVNYSIEIFDTSTEGMFKIINSYIPSASPSIISKTITNTSSNISITGTSEPYLCTITDSDVTTANFVRLYPLDEDTETWLNDNTSSSIITESSGKFTFKVTTNTLPQTFTMKYFIQ